MISVIILITGCVKENIIDKTDSKDLDKSLQKDKIEEEQGLEELEEVEEHEAKVEKIQKLEIKEEINKDLVKAEETPIKYEDLGVSQEDFDKLARDLEKMEFEDIEGFSE